MQPIEFATWQYYLRAPAPLDIDTNKDRKVDDDELLAWAKDWMLDYDALVSLGEVTPQRVSHIQPDAPPKPWSIEPFRLRKDPEALAKKLKDAEPATAGYYRNGLTSEDTWTVEGTLGALIPLYEAPTSSLSGYNLQDVSLVPSVSLNRITGTGDGSLSEVDALAYRAGISAVIQGTQDTFFDLHRFMINYRYVGSLEGGDFKSGGELDWEPMRNRQKSFFNFNGPFQPLLFNADTEGKGIHYRTVLAGRIEAGESDTGETFAKAGGRFGLQAYHTALPRLIAFANYTYLWEMADGQRDFDYLETGIRWQLDDLKQIFIEGKYRYGQVPAKYTDLDLIQLSLAVRF